MTRVAGPAVAAFEAQVEAEESGVMFTPEQWSFSRRSPPRLANGSATARMPAAQVEDIFGGPTQIMSVVQLDGLLEHCRKE